MGKWWWSEQWGRGGGVTTGQGVVVWSVGKGLVFDQWGERGSVLTNGEEVVV